MSNERLVKIKRSLEKINSLMDAHRTAHGMKTKPCEEKRFLVATGKSKAAKALGYDPEGKRRYVVYDVDLEVVIFHSPSKSKADAHAKALNDRTCMTRKYGGLEAVGGTGLTMIDQAIWRISGRLQNKSKAALRIVQ